MEDSYGQYFGRAGLNTTMMVAFAVPGLKTAQSNPALRKAGGVAGVAAAAGLFMMDLFDYLSPGSTPAGDQPVTSADLQTALDDLKAGVVNAMWKAGIDQITDQLVALNQSFQDTLTAMQELPMDDDSYKLIDINDSLEDFISETYKYFDTQHPAKLLTRLRAFRNAIQMDSYNDGSVNALQLLEHQTRTIGLYTLLGSLTASYLKAAVIWKWGRELLLAWQYGEYQKAKDLWTDQDAAYQAAHPLSDLTAQYDKTVSSPYYLPPDWEHWIGQPGSPRQLLIDEVQDLLDYCVGKPAQDGLYIRMAKQLDEMEKHAVDGDAALNPGAVTGGDLHTAVEQGAIRAGWLEVLGTKYGLAEVGEDDITQFGEAIDAWRATAASVNFRTYTVTKGKGTFVDLAKIGYKDGNFASALSIANPGVSLENNRYVPVGTILKIFTKEALVELKVPVPGPGI